MVPSCEKWSPHISQLNSFFSWCTEKTWVFNWYENLVSQMLQTKGFFPSWTNCIWFFCPPDDVNLASHMSHLKGFIPSWIEVKWDMSLLLDVKLDSHIEQLKSFFFAFSWADNTCIFMSLGWLKVELHILHWCRGFFPSWTVWMWVFKLTFDAKYTSHLSHVTCYFHKYFWYEYSDQMWSLSKVFITNCTWKGLFSIMNSCNMSSQNKIGCEIFFKNGTFERFFTLMSNLDVPFHMTLVCEICITYPALKWLFFFMNSWDMQFQILFWRKFTFTYCAIEGSLSNMDWCYMSF